jgi:hypothetical protein
MFQGNDIEQLIIEGGNAVKLYKFKVNGEDRQLKWSPILATRAQIAFAKGLENIDDIMARQWINTSPNKHKELFGDKYVPATPDLLMFNHWNTLWTIKFALEPHYPNITVYKVEQLPINHRELFLQISIGSGLIKSEETARSFRGKSEEQPTENTPEQGDTVGTSGA